MSGSRVILVILIALGGLFVVGLVIGMGDDTEGVNPNGYSWIQALRAGFIEEEGLKVSDIRANCLRQNTFSIRVSSTCHAEIRGAEPRIRIMKLRLIEGESAQVKLEPQGENAIPVQVTLRNTSPKPTTLQIFKGREELPVAATLSLTCERASSPPARCTVQLQ